MRISRKHKNQVLDQTLFVPEPIKTTKTIPIKYITECIFCTGSGKKVMVDKFAKVHYEFCPNCHGLGEVEV
jgi:hypothetical protein